MKKSVLYPLILGIVLWLSLTLNVETVQAQGDLITCVNSEGEEYEAENCDRLPPSEEPNGDVVTLAPEHDFVMPPAWRCSRVFTFWRQNQTNFSTITWTQPAQIVQYTTDYDLRLDTAILEMNAAGVVLGDGDIFHARILGDAWWEVTSTQARSILAGWAQNGAVIAIENEYASFVGYSLEPNALFTALGVGFQQRLTEPYVPEPNQTWWVGPMGSSTRWDKWFSSAAQLTGFGRGEYYATAGYNYTQSTRVLYISPTYRIPLMVEERLGLGLVRAVGDTSFQNHLDIPAKEGVAQQWATFMGCTEHSGVPTSVTIVSARVEAIPLRDGLVFFSILAGFFLIIYLVDQWRRK